MRLVPLYRWCLHLCRLAGVGAPVSRRIFAFHVKLYHRAFRNATRRWVYRPDISRIQQRRFYPYDCGCNLREPLTFPPFNAIVPPEISVDGEEPAMRRAERGPLGARAPRQAAAVPLRSRPGRPGRDRPLQRTRAAAPLAGTASRVEPWNTTSYPTPEHIRGGFFHSYPNYKEDYHERGKQSVYL